MPPLKLQNSIRLTGFLWNKSVFMPWNNSMHKSSFISVSVKIQMILEGKEKAIKISTPYLVVNWGFKDYNIRESFSESQQITSVNLRSGHLTEAYSEPSQTSKMESNVNLPVSDRIHPHPKVIKRLSKQIPFNLHFYLTSRHQRNITNSGH